MTALFSKHTIEATGSTLIFVSGFPTRSQLAIWFSDEDEATIYCLFPSTFRDDQAQVQLRQAIRSAMEAHPTVPAQRCLALVLADSTLGESLDDFDFPRACQQTLNQLTPKQPSPSRKRVLPRFGD